MNKASKLKKISAICAAFMFALLSIFAALVTQNRTAYKMEVPFEAKAEETATEQAEPKNLFAVADCVQEVNGIKFTWKNNICTIEGMLTEDTNQSVFFQLKNPISAGKYYFRSWNTFSGTVITGLALANEAWKYQVSFPYFGADMESRTTTELSYIAYFFIKGSKGGRVYLPFIKPVISVSSFEDYTPPDDIQQKIEDSYKAGLVKGYEEKYGNVYENGLNEGYKNGYTAGKNENTQSYYDKGYSDGWAASGSGTFTSLFTAVIDAPVAAFTNLLDFQILGVDMKKFALALISLALVLAIVRFVLGKS